MENLAFSTWKNDLKNELDLERPILYSAGGAEIGDDWVYGHSWVIEGYNSNDEFYCNWGWSNKNNCNGWYSLGGFKPFDDNYNQMESAIFNVYPVQPAGVATPLLSNQSFTYSPNGYVLTIPPAYGATSYEWITNKGTISGSGTTVTLCTESTANVQVRAYNNNCQIYSPYKSVNITVNYGPISAPDIICFSGTTVSLQNVPNTIITWGGTRVAYPNGNVGTSVSLRAAGTGIGTITASFTINGTPYIISKSIWAGVPNAPNYITPFPNNGKEFAINSYYEFYLSPQPGATYLTWNVSGGTIIEGQGTSFVLVRTVSYPTNFSLSVKSGNNCGESSYFTRTGYVVDEDLPINAIPPGETSAEVNFPEVQELKQGFISAAYSITFAPNPNIGETTLTIESNSMEKIIDDDAQWDLEVYSESQLLKTKQTGLRGRSAKIQTAGWQEGIYLVRVNYKNEVLTGKLVVKR